jgi:hypothetical protein
MVTKAPTITRARNWKAARQCLFRRVAPCLAGEFIKLLDSQVFHSPFHCLNVSALDAIDKKPRAQRPFLLNYLNLAFGGGIGIDLGWTAE